MNAWLVRRAKAVWLLGFGVVLAGLATVLFFVCQSLLPGARVPHLVPQLSTAWLEQATRHPPLYKFSWLLAGVNAELAFAVLGLLAMILGAAIARRPIAALEAARSESEDRLRRVRQYMSDDRIEPYIGRMITVSDDYEPR
jgi:hypothetical protein